MEELPIPQVLSSITAMGLRLTALILLLDLQIAPPLNVLFRILGGAVLLNDRLAKSPLVWTAILFCLGTADFLSWRQLDNHQYLVLYWCLACLLSLLSRTPESTLRWNARILVSLTFAAAVIAKVASGEYSDGTFAHFTALSDPRLQWVTSRLGGIQVTALVKNRRLLDSIIASPGIPSTLVLATSDVVRNAAKPLGWTLLAFELLVAFAFFPGILHRRLGVIGDILLLGFIFGTYFALPVVAFGSLLAIFGYVQTEREVSKFPVRRVYIFALIAIQFAEFVYPRH